MRKAEVKENKLWWYITGHPQHWFAGYPFPSRTAALEALQTWTQVPGDGTFCANDIPLEPVHAGS
jgi:hypothetical protein